MILEVPRQQPGPCVGAQGIPEVPDVWERPAGPVSHPGLPSPSWRGSIPHGVLPALGTCYSEAKSNPTRPLLHKGKTCSISSGQKRVQSSLHTITSFWGHCMRRTGAWESGTGDTWHPALCLAAAAVVRQSSEAGDTGSPDRNAAKEGLRIWRTALVSKGRNKSCLCWYQTNR